MRYNWSFKIWKFPPNIVITKYIMWRFLLILFFFFLIGSKIYIFKTLYYRLCFNILSPYLVNFEESTVLTLGNSGLPRWHSGKELTCQCRKCKRCEFDPWVRNILWVGNGNPLQYSLSGKFHGQMNLVGYSPW